MPVTPHSDHLFNSFLKKMGVKQKPLTFLQVPSRLKCHKVLCIPLMHELLHFELVFDIKLFEWLNFHVCYTFDLICLF
jgi:hypothetical protein